MAKQYLNAFINNSATIRGTAAADLTNAAHKAVKFDGNGQFVLPGAGDPVIGIILSDVAAIESGANLVTKAGTEVDVLVKYIGLIEAAGAIAKGDLLTVTATGTATQADEGNWIFGVAMTAAGAAGELVQIEITQSGYYPVAA
ncbi:MAG: DUF2190 family protein [Oscillospiraceae bacterium]|jgi:hypothetical protein|nr:DUF2190 family protein [Oscillospiraceae bacterium]